MRPIAAGLLALSALLSPPASQAQSRLSPGFAAGEAGLTPSERAGREIWFFATAGNDRFHTYVLPQRLGVAIDWYGILNAESRDRRFRTWGLINDPDCCVPGSDGCPATSLEQTYGFDYCPGDDDLLAHVGKTGYRDPACDFQDAPWTPGGPHGDTDQRDSAVCSGVRHLDRRARLSQVPQPALRREGLARAERRLAGILGRVSREPRLRRR